jgi:hypothetical protein
MTGGKIETGLHPRGVVLALPAAGCQPERISDVVLSFLTVGVDVFDYISKNGLPPDFLGMKLAIRFLI